MILIKDLGTKTSDKGSTERWCIAECPLCGVQKELAMGQVKRNPDAVCQTCSAQKVAEQNRVKAASEFVVKAKSVHGDLFDYTNTVYIKNQEKVDIYCNNCNQSFQQRPADHKRGAGCPLCKTKGGWSYSDWEKAGEGKDGYKIYLVECWSDNERFLKIGKTFNTLSRRFSGNKNMPYDWKVITTIEGSAKFICDLEQKLHNKYKESKYLPVLNFHGKHECYLYTDEQKIRGVFYDTAGVQK